MTGEFVLVEIIDAHSPYKSDIAKKLVAGSFMTYGIKYREDTGIVSKYCMNNLYYKSKDKIKRRDPKNKCLRNIADLFVIRDKEDRFLTIGNNCIETLVLADVIANVDKRGCSRILNTLKKTKVCILCGKFSTVDIHLACVKGHAKKLAVDKEQIINHISKNNQIVIRDLLERVRGLFDGIAFIKDCRINNRAGRKTITALNAFIGEYELLIDNKDKLLSLKHNCIVNSIKQQRRKPSAKQMKILCMIVRDFIRIKKLDGKNTNAKYMKYGYVY